MGGSVPESLGCLVGGSGRVSPLYWPLWFWWYLHSPAKLSGTAVLTGEGVLRGRAKIGSSLLTQPQITLVCPRYRCRALWLNDPHTAAGIGG